MPKKKTDTVTEATPKAAPEKKEYKAKRRKLEPNTLITVRNGFNGVLVYVCSRTGERFMWDGFGAENDMELQDLRAAKNSAKGFFENNWFMIDDQDVLEYLGVERMYRNSLTLDGFDELFELPVDQIEEKIQNIPNGQRASVAYRAKQLIDEGKIDSIKVITVLEKCLGVELIDR